MEGRSSSRNLCREEGTYDRYAASDWTDFDSINTLTQTIDPESNRYGAYLQAQLTPLQKLAVYLGHRYDWWDSQATRKTPTLSERLESQDQDSFSPKLSILYTPWQDTTLRLSGGKAFRVPNFFELYQPLTTSGTTYRPNPNLKPEITWGWEGGDPGLPHGVLDPPSRQGPGRTSPLKSGYVSQSPVASLTSRVGR